MKKLKFLFGVSLLALSSCSTYVDGEIPVDPNRNNDFLFLA